MFATVAKTESNASISSAETTLPLTLSSSTFESLNAWASVYSSSIINKLFERSRSFRFSHWLMTSPNFSATSDDNLLLAIWHTFRLLFIIKASATLSPAKSSNKLLLILNSFKFLTQEIKAYSDSAAWGLISFWLRYNFSSFGWSTIAWRIYSSPL